MCAPVLSSFSCPHQNPSLAFTMASVESEFQAAADSVKTFTPSKTVSNADKLKAYALFKQVRATWGALPPSAQTPCVRPETPCPPPRACPYRLP